MVKTFTTYIGSLLLICGVMLSTSAEANVLLSVDRNPVALNESFTLTLSSDESLDGSPDFDWIDRELDVVNRQQSSNFQMINGDVSRSISWTMTVIAKRSGSILIPPVKVGDRESNSLELTVNEGSQSRPSASGGSSDPLFLQLAVEEGDLYVQQQILYTIKLLLAHDAGMSVGNGSSLSEPELETGDAVIKRLGEDSNYQTEINGQRYSVIERRYAFYPQQSGSLKIKPILFEGQMVESSNRAQSIFDRFQQRSRIKRIESESVVREIKAIPPTYQGAHWLPAKSVELVEEWPQSGQGMKVGEPVTRTLALMVDGLTSAQLPSLETSYPQGIKSYPDQPLLKETPSEQGVAALRQEKIALVASTPGQLTLPAIELTWWNTVTGHQEMARLAERTINVEAAAGSNAPAPPMQPPIITSTPDEKSEPVVSSEVVGANDSRWQMVAIAVTVGWLLTLLLWWRSARQGVVRPKENNPTVETLRAARKKVKEACHSGDVSAAQGALIGWAQIQWPQARPASLGELAGRVSDELAAAIDALSRSLYSEEKEEWRGDRLWQAFNAPQGESSTESKPSELAPLFRHQ